MNAIYAALICVAGALITSILRRDRPEVALGVALATGVVAISVCLPDLTSAVGALTELARKAGVGDSGVTIMLRATGIAIIAEFASQVCVDAGESALAGRIELATRLALLAMATPLIVEILSRASALVG